MNIFIGTNSGQTIKIVNNVLAANHVRGDLIPTEVKSDIVGQPLNEEVTIRGSINRAKNAIQENKGIPYDFSLGLEGGLVLINDNFNLVCAASIVDKEGQIYTGVSGKTPLPRELTEKIKDGEEFGTLIKDFETNMVNPSEDMKCLITELVNRTQSFSDAFDSALMQYQYKEYFSK